MSSSPPYLGQNCSTPVSSRRVFRRILWALVQATLFRWSPRPFHWWRAILLKCFGAAIENPSRVVIFPTARITYPENLTLEDRTMIGPRVDIYNLGQVWLRFGANISQNCHLCAGTHDFERWDMPLITAPIEIGQNTWLAADVFVGPGVTVGELAVVGARSVVVRDLPASQVCVGNPCRPVKPRQHPVTFPQ